MSSDVRELVRDAAPEPSRPLDVERLWNRGRRQRRRRIAGGIAGAVAMLVAVVVALPGVPSQDAGPVAPEILDDPTVRLEVPVGWRTLRIGQARFSVPATWPVEEIGGPSDEMPCLDLLTTAEVRVWLADRLWQPSCPAGSSSPGAGQVSVYAFPASARQGSGSGGDDALSEAAARIAQEGRPVQLPVGEAIMVESDRLRSYLFAELDAVLLIAYRPDLQLADQIVASVRHDDRPAETPGDGASTTGSPAIVDELPAAPVAPRHGHSVVWTGTEMLVWGGSAHTGSTVETHNDGAAYDPQSVSWRQLPASPGTGSVNHVAVWTGTRMLVAGGARTQRTVEAYDPRTDSWTSGADAPFPVNRGTTAYAWTGQHLAVWTPGIGYAQYDPADDSWTQPAPPPLEAPNDLTSSTQALHAHGDLLYAVAADLHDPVQVAVRTSDGPWERADDLGPRTGRFPDGDRLSEQILARLTVATDAGLVAVPRSGDTIPAALLSPETGGWSDLPVPGIDSCEDYPRPLAIPGGALIFNNCGSSAFFDATDRAFTVLDDVPTFPPGDAAHSVWTGRTVLTYATACCFGGGGATQMGSWERDPNAIDS